MTSDPPRPSSDLSRDRNDADQSPGCLYSGSITGLPAPDTASGTPARRAHRRVINAKVMAIVAVGADLAATDSEHEITIVDLRAGLTERGLYVDEKGNQALGDVLGVTGLNLPSTMRKYIDFLEPGQPPPRGWRRARGFVHQSGLLAYAQSRRCYRWPPPPGIDRAFLAERFLVPEGWDWSAFGL